MRIFSRSTLLSFIAAHADAEDALLTWFRDAKAANWTNPNEVKAYASTVSLLSHERVCFNIKGNAYRLVVAVDYEYGFLYIKFIGTHAEYNKIDVETVEFTKGDR